MVNEALQWTVIVVVVLLLLGVLRQLAALTPARGRRTESGPPVGKKVPADLVREISTVLDGASSGSRNARERLVAFVMEGCVGCMRLLADLESGGKPRLVDDTPFVLVARKPTPDFEARLVEAGFLVVPDRTGDVWTNSGITSTPLVMRVDTEGKVLSKAVTVDVTSVAASG